MKSKAITSPTAPTTRATTAYGRGGLEQLPSGRWRVRLTVDGARVCETCDTLEEAEALRRGLVQARLDCDREKARRPSPEPEVLTLASWGKTWLARRADRKLVRWPEIDRKRWAMHVDGTELAALPLVEVRSRHIRAWLNHLLAKEHGAKALKPQTIRHAFNLVRKALADALEDEVIATNAATGVKIPARHTGEAVADVWTFLAADEVRAVEACEAIPEASRLLLVVAIYTGLRAGEMWNLRWGDVREADARPEVIVRASWKGAPKNGKAQPVPLLPKAREALARLRALATVEGEGPAVDALVFPTVTGCQRQCGDDGGWGTRTVRGRHRDGLMLRAGITRRVRFHDLRHTCASHLLMGTWGVTLALAEVSSFLRHGSIAMTQRYAHLAPGHLHARISSGGVSSGNAPVEAATRRDNHSRGGAVGRGADLDASRPGVAPPRPLAGVANIGHADPSNSGHAEGATFTKPLVFRARPRRLELRTYGLEGHRSIQLSYGRKELTGTSRCAALRGNGSRSGRRDLNPRHPAPKAGALPGCATPRLNAA